MPNGWIKSLQCKSKAFDDVYNFNSKSLMSSSSYNCSRKSSHCVKDVIDTRLSKKNQKPDPNLRRFKSCRTETELLNPPNRTRRSKSARTSDALTELPDGHPSRNVVEIIFHSSWSSDEFPGRIEMIFKVEHGSRTVTRFEEYREVVKSRAGFNGGTCEEEDARCLADGNEMMRFYPVLDGFNGGAIYLTTPHHNNEEEEEEEELQEDKYTIFYRLQCPYPLKSFKGRGFLVSLLSRLPSPNHRRLRF